MELGEDTALRLKLLLWLECLACSQQILWIKDYPSKNTTGPATSRLFFLLSRNYSLAGQGAGQRDYRNYNRVKTPRYREGSVLSCLQNPMYLLLHIVRSVQEPERSGGGQELRTKGPCYRCEDNRFTTETNTRLSQMMPT